MNTGSIGNYNELQDCAGTEGGVTNNSVDHIYFSLVHPSIVQIVNCQLHSHRTLCKMAGKRPFPIIDILSRRLSTIPRRLSLAPFLHTYLGLGELGAGHKGTSPGQEGSKSKSHGLHDG